MTDRYLFPCRQTRRDFLRTAGLALAAPLLTCADDSPAKVTVGEGAFRYELDPNWGRLPAGMSYGYGCAVVVDGQDRVFVTSRSTNPCVAIFDREGQLLETWSNDFGEKIGYSVEQYKDTAHGLYWSREGDQEFLYWTENASTNKEGPKFGRRVYKTDLKGKVLYTLGPGVKESSNSQAFDFTNPTDVAVAPNGDIYIVDGYGSQKVHRFDKNFKWLKTIGGPGKDHGQFNVCHGIWVSTLGKEPEVYIADRHNDRIEVFSLELEYKRTVGDIRTPCCFYQHQGHLFVPELGQRVTVLDAQDRVAARLGDGKGFEKEIARHPDKFAFPHALTLDSRGDLYVIEWLPDARPRKFRRLNA
ncbi:MAG: hypothetical protein N2039_09225 [Gemmataceae bacterium]|nr:hypothetical protein [Gemmataceae bacterium]